MSAGQFSVWAQKDGDFHAREFDGTPAGVASAVAYCGSNGIVVCGPGSGGISIPTVPAGVKLVINNLGTEKEYVGSTAVWTGQLREPVLNVKDFATFQAAHDALPTTGGTIYVPAGFYNSTTVPAFGSASTPGMRITKNNVAVIGDGSLISAVRQSGSAGQHGFLVEANVVTIRGLYIAGAAANGSGCGVRWLKPSGFMTTLVLDDLYMEDAPSWCVYVSAASGQYANKLLLNNVSCSTLYNNAGGDGWGGCLRVGDGGGTQSYDNLRAVNCEFAGSSAGSHGTLPVQTGTVYLERATNFRFSGCSFQGVATRPVLSLVSTSSIQLVGGCYIERAGAGTPVAAITASGANHCVNVDGMYYMQGSSSEIRMLQSDSAAVGLVGCSMANVQVNTHDGTMSRANAIVLNNAADELRIDNVFVTNSANTNRASIIAAGAGAAFKTVASATTLTLPVSEPGVYFISGTTTITSITAQGIGRRATLIFTSTAQVTDGSNLKLNGNSTGSADRTLSLICDGTNWYETGRA